MNGLTDIGHRLELFVDRQLIDRLEQAELRLHRPQPMPLAGTSLPIAYSTVIKEGDRYQAYYRSYLSGYAGPFQDGNPGEVYCRAESSDGHEWRFPELGVIDTPGPQGGNVIMAEAPFCHNLSPFLDMNPAADRRHRYKALAGTRHDLLVTRYPGSLRAMEVRRVEAGHQGAVDIQGGLYAFSSPDGIRWSRMQDSPVIRLQDCLAATCNGWAFDSQNVSFWSSAEGCYVCYFRTAIMLQGTLRSISRTTSSDFIHWTKPVCMKPNLPGEHLYTSNTHPYFRAPHIYVSLPTRFMPDRGESTDVLFMSTRAGCESYERLFTEAFIRPGPDPARWGNRANYVAQNVVPTGPSEMSIYHKDGHRYVLRTDGFVSVQCGAGPGELLTKPLTFSGSELIVNYSTSVAGSLQVEIQEASGRPIPGFRADDCPAVVGDAIEQAVKWRGSPCLATLAGCPVRLRFVMTECDLYSFRFRDASEKA